MCLLLIVGFYAGYSWYYFCHADMEASAVEEKVYMILRLAGTLLLLLGSGVLGYLLAMVRPSSSDYLIDMDVELRKVVWPSIQPLFDPKAEAWGSTYIVIACTVIITVYIWIVDSVLDFSITQHLLQWLAA